MQTIYLSASDVGVMPDSEIISLANARGYTITGITHQELVDEFILEQRLGYEFTKNKLKKLTLNEINEIALLRGYSITQTLKADIIEEFLSQQNS